jgi:hypothetical protein
MSIVKPKAETKKLGMFHIISNCACSLPWAPHQHTENSTTKPHQKTTLIHSFVQKVPRADTGL